MRRKAQTEMEVRCCCNPNVLIGWLPVPIPYNIGPLTFLIPPVLPASPLTHLDPEIQNGKTVTLHIGKLIDRTQAIYALNSNDTPIETLRQIPGFIEYSKS